MVLVGLGLAVVARIVDQLGGQLRIDSKVGEGTRASILLPFATRMQEDHDATPESIRAGSAKQGDPASGFVSLVDSHAFAALSLAART